MHKQRDYSYITPRLFEVEIKGLTKFRSKPNLSRQPTPTISVQRKPNSISDEMPPPITKDNLIKETLYPVPSKVKDTLSRSAADLCLAELIPIQEMYDKATSFGCYHHNYDFMKNEIRRDLAQFQQDFNKVKSSLSKSLIIEIYNALDALTTKVSTMPPSSVQERRRTNRYSTDYYGRNRW